MSNKNIATVNVLSSMFLQLVSIISGFILPRLILSYFGSNITGLISSIGQFLNYISLFEGGVSMVIMSSLYAPLANKDYKKVSGIIKAADSFYRKLGLMYVVYALVISIGYPLVVKTPYSFAFVASLSVILSSNLFVQFMFSISYRTLLIADRNGYIVYFSQSAFFVLNLIISFVVLAIYPEIHVLKFASAAAFAIQPLLYGIYIKKHYPLDKHIEPDEEALAQKWDGFGQNFALFIHNNTDVMVLTFFATLKDIAVYSIFFMVTNAVKTIVSSVSNALLPSVGNVYITGDKGRIKNSFNIYVAIVYTLSSFVFSMCVILLIPFVRIYTSTVHDANYIQPLFGIILTTAYILECLREPYLQLTFVAKKFKETTKYAFIEAIINIVISIILVVKYGLIGVAIGTVISVIYRFVVLIQFCKKNIIDLSIRKVIGDLLYVTVPIVISYILVNKLFTFTSITMLGWVIFAAKCAFIVIPVIIINTLILKRKDMMEVIRMRRSKKGRV